MVLVTRVTRLVLRWQAGLSAQTPLAPYYSDAQPSGRQGQFPALNKLINSSRFPDSITSWGFVIANDGTGCIL
jgi:hypothetical protein